MKTLVRSTLLAAAVCAVGPAARAGGSAQDADAPTFSRDVAPILQSKCQACHRPGQIAPMSLLAYDDCRPWVKSIREQVAKRAMPPWHAARGLREYQNDRSLSDAEVETIVRWAEAGAPQGDAKDLPPPAVFKEGWTLGEPDSIIQMDAPYAVAATGDDEYRCFVLDPKTTEERWATAVEILPGAREIDHHIVLYVDAKGVSPKEDAKDPGPGYSCFGGPGFQADMLAGWGPGLSPKVYPEGTGHPIPAGAKIVMQMHYHKSGKPAEDQTRVGLHYAKAPVAKRMRDGIVLNFRLDIPPGEPAYAVDAEKKIYHDLTVYSVIPHMHLLGKSMAMWAELPDGSRVDFVAVPRWDFNWQTEYAFAKPVRLPKGSTVRLAATFDNSAENPFQPVHPPREVGFGEQTTDEMCVGVFNYTEDRENLEPAGEAGQ